MDRMRQTVYKRVEQMGKPTEEAMEMFPFLWVSELMHHEMKLRFGLDLELSLHNTLSILTPDVIRVADSGSQRERLSSLRDTNTDDLQKSAAVLILPALFKEDDKFLYCLDKEPLCFQPSSSRVAILPSLPGEHP
ncbi:hypothetical protein AALO_G00271730 [Alosa alosa]|uniref:Uncharacterized protein n=1 Tax=Alosa alosa TaxID=278164 RepID=A0AAV6FMF4_9TELE|nr:hypothetical protein AALO_G00271730 [Alosa alosa]